MAGAPSLGAVRSHLGGDRARAPGRLPRPSDGQLRRAHARLGRQQPRVRPDQ